MAKVSIIIPVYNVENYLNKCLDSLVNQTLNDIEIVCVDDGSKDSSLEILNRYASMDARVKVFSQKNQGPAVARNLGIEKATGEYITFVDSDDWVTLDMCEKLYNKAVKTGVDVVLFEHSRVANNVETEDERLKKIKSSIPNEIFCFDNGNEAKIDDVPVETVGKFYKSSLISKNNIKFPVNIDNGEDTCFFYTICLKRPSFTIIPEPMYFYRYDRIGNQSKKDYVVESLSKVLKYIEENSYKSKVENKEKFFYFFIRRIAKSFIYFWNSYYTISNKKNCYKYIKYLYNLYKKLPRENEDVTFDNLKKSINDYKKQFIFKFLEPVFEKEVRGIRFVIYLFGHQVLNVSMLNALRKEHNRLYTLNLLKLRILSKFRKIRVGFLAVEPSKWAGNYLLEFLKKDEHFEPFIIQSYFSSPQGEIPPRTYYDGAKNFYKTLNVPIYEAFDSDDYTFKELKEFKPDIVFYEQPWLVPKEHFLLKTAQKSLICYIPYCFYSGESYVNYMPSFHNLLWKYFVETNIHKTDYEKKYGAKNCVAVGSTKLDHYHFIDKERAEKYWKTKNKKRIIYAPHHSFENSIHRVATFDKNGQVILELAKSHPETEWIFRPHPAFADRLIKDSIMTTDEIERYYDEWRKIGTISTGGNYYEMFSSSDILITDCISFLSEYAPTLNPVLHLRKDKQKEEFNSLVKKIDESYYQIYSNEQLIETFNRVVIQGDDYLKEKRQNNLNILPYHEFASKNIYEYIKKALWMK